MDKIVATVELFNDPVDGWLVTLDGEPVEPTLTQAGNQPRPNKRQVELMLADAVAAGVRAGQAPDVEWTKTDTASGFKWTLSQVVPAAALARLDEMLNEVTRQHQRGLLTQNGAAMKASELLFARGGTEATCAAAFIAANFTEEDNLWLLRFTEHNGDKEYGQDLVVTARDEPEAKRLARKLALHWYDDQDSEMLEDGQVEFEGGSIRIEIEYVQPVTRAEIVRRAMR